VRLLTEDSLDLLGIKSQNNFSNLRCIR